MPKAIAAKTPASKQRRSNPTGKPTTEITAKPGRRRGGSAAENAAPAPSAAHATKKDRLLGLLGRPGGASLAELMDASAWQAHSVRGFLAGTVGKRLGFAVTSEMADGTRRYRIAPRRTV